MNKRPKRLSGSSWLLIIGGAVVLGCCLFFYFALSHPTMTSILPAGLSEAIFYGGFVMGVLSLVVGVVIKIVRAIM